MGRQESDNNNEIQNFAMAWLIDSPPLAMQEDFLCIIKH